MSQDVPLLKYVALGMGIAVLYMGGERDEIPRGLHLATSTPTPHG